jgi:hypothetical protein
LPQAGDVCWGRFPYDKSLGNPGPKARPCLVLAVYQEETRYQVLVAYGTTQLQRGLKSGEFLLDDRKAMAQAGLTDDTKFDLNNHVLLPYNDKWFEIEPASNQ